MEDLDHTGLDSSFNTHNDYYTYDKEGIDKLFDKSIITLRIAIKKLGPKVETGEDNWVIYDILPHHKNMLNSQIDLLIKEKKSKGKKAVSIGL
jgi:hypothetical protein